MMYNSKKFKKEFTIKDFPDVVIYIYQMIQTNYVH